MALFMRQLNSNHSLFIQGTVVTFEQITAEGVDVHLLLGEYPISWRSPLGVGIREEWQFAELLHLKALVIPVITLELLKEVGLNLPNIVREFTHLEWMQPESVVYQHGNFLQRFPNSTPWTRRRLASSLNFSDETLPGEGLISILSEDPNKRVRISLIDNTSVPFFSLYPKLLTDEDKEVRGALLKRKGIPLEVMQSALRTEDMSVYVNLACNPTTPDYILKEIVQIHNQCGSDIYGQADMAKVRTYWAVARAAKKLACSPDVSCRLTAASYSDLPPETRSLLVEDPSPKVRLALLRSINLSALSDFPSISNMLHALSVDEDKEVVSFARYVLKKVNTLTSDSF